MFVCLFNKNTDVDMIIVGTKYLGMCMPCVKEFIGMKTITEKNTLPLRYRRISI